MLREQRTLVLRALQAIAKGERRFRGGIDTTELVRVREEQILRSLDTAIAAYESHNDDES